MMDKIKDIVKEIFYKYDECISFTDLERAREEVEVIIQQYTEKQKTKIAELTEVVEFYADPLTYFAVLTFPDPPSGPIMDDFSDTELGQKPGKKARKLLEKLYKKGDCK